MLIDLSKPILGINKEPIRDREDVVTLKKAILLALMQPNPHPQALTPEDAVKHRKLFEKIDGAEKELELKAEEIVKIKEIACSRLTEVIGGAICLLLDPEG